MGDFGLRCTKAGLYCGTAGKESCRWFDRLVSALGGHLDYIERLALLVPMTLRFFGYAERFAARNRASLSVIKVLKIEIASVQ